MDTMDHCNRRHLVSWSFFLFHGIGYSKYKDSLDFKAGYFVIGILMLAPVYYYIHSTIASEKDFHWKISIKTLSLKI